MCFRFCYRNSFRFFLDKEHIGRLRWQSSANAAGNQRGDDVTQKAGLVKASVGWHEYRGRLPWNSRPSYYAAIERGEIPSVRFASAVYVPRWALEALVNGDVDALQRGRQQTTGV